MKSLLLLLFFIAHTACDVVKDLPDDSKNTSQKETTEDSNTSPSVAQSGIPGNITFKAKVLETYGAKKEICGVSKSNVLKVEVIELLESGSGITNAPHKKEVLLVSFLFAPENLDLNTIIVAKAMESLCPSASKTYFTVNSYKILEE